MLLSRVPLAGALCNQKSLSEKVHYYQSTVDQEKAARGSWFKYKLSDYPNFVLDPVANPKCVAVYQPNKGWTTIELKNSFKPSPSFEDYFTLGTETVMFSADPDAAAKAELDGIRKKMNLGPAFVFTWGAFQPDPNNKELAALREKIPSENVDAMRIAIHEAFHLLVQNPLRTAALNKPSCPCVDGQTICKDLKSISESANVSSKTWPKFAQETVRDEDLQACYVGTPRIKELHRQEIKVLADALVASSDADAKALIQKFLDLRRQRQALNPSFKAITLVSGETKTLSCKEEEAKQELHEGVPQFVGNALIVDQNRATLKQVADEIVLTTNYYLDRSPGPKERPIQSYYHAGSLELLLIRRFYDKDFLELTREISKTESSTNLTDLLEQTVFKSDYSRRKIQ